MLIRKIVCIANIVPKILRKIIKAKDVGGILL
jgi:hypothetical protein